MARIVLGMLSCIIAGSVWAQTSGGVESDFIAWIEAQLITVTHFLGAIFFVEMGDIPGLGVIFNRIPIVKDIPFLIAWLIAGSIFFTIRLGFVNFTLFGHAINAVRGKYSHAEDKGEISHFKALSAAVSATVGLGNIAGVAIAVGIGGPGAVIWMVIAGFFGMSAKFAEVTMGQKYRVIDANGHVSGGAFHYLSQGLKEKGLGALGRVLAVIFALFCLFGALGAGNLFQSNQAVSILSNSFGLKELDALLALIIMVVVGIVILGGIKRIATVASRIVPFMAITYIIACLVIILLHIGELGNAFSTMFSAAFGMEAAAGGILGAIINGFKRAAFSSEAGIGSAAIAHAAARTNEPVREGCVALLEPFIDTVVICFLTGIVLTITGAYQAQVGGDLKGVLMTQEAFATVSSWFPYVLTVVVVLFAYSTMITWSYYGERAWGYLFGDKTVILFKITFCACIFIGGVTQLSALLNLIDILFLSIAVPNLLGLYILSNDLAKDVKTYKQKLKSGVFG